MRVGQTVGAGYVAGVNLASSTTRTVLGYEGGALDEARAYEAEQREWARPRI